MRSVHLTEASKWCRRFNDWARGRVTEEHNKKQLAEYLDVTIDTINKRLRGDIAWDLKSAMEVIEFYGESPEQVLK